MHHGGEWHQETMAKIEKHFIYSGCKVEREPTIRWGRADLGVYKNGSLNLYIEVGTVSLFKLWMNLSLVKDCVYLIVPNDDKLIEFKV